MPTAALVHLLAPGEAPLLRAMLSVFGEAFEDPETYLAHQPSDAQLEALLARDTFVAFAALDEGAVVGALTGYVLPKFEQPRAEFYVYDLAVATAYRRRGIATALLEASRRLAHARELHVLFVQADRGDDAAIALYSRLGRREEVLHFDFSPSP